MALDLQTELRQVHALLDQVPPAKLGAVRSFLEVMLDDDEEELTEADRQAIQVGLDSLAKHGTVSMEEVLADFGLTMADFEAMPDEPEALPAPKLNG
jgi:hypothetical protein